MKASEFLENLKNDILKGYMEDVEKKEIVKQIEKAESELRRSLKKNKDTMEFLVTWVMFYLTGESLSNELSTVRAIEMRDFHHKVLRKEMLILMLKCILKEFNIFDV